MGLWSGLPGIRRRRGFGGQVSGTMCFHQRWHTSVLAITVQSGTQNQTVELRESVAYPKGIATVSVASNDIHHDRMGIIGMQEAGLAEHD